MKLKEPGLKTAYITYPDLSIPIGIYPLQLQILDNDCNIELLSPVFSFDNISSYDKLLSVSDVLFRFHRLNVLPMRFAVKSNQSMTAALAFSNVIL